MNSVSRNFSWDFFSLHPPPPRLSPIMFYTCITNSQSPQARCMQELFVWALCTGVLPSSVYIVELRGFSDLLRHVKKNKKTKTQVDVRKTALLCLIFRTVSTTSTVSPYYWENKRLSSRQTARSSKVLPEPHLYVQYHAKILSHPSFLHMLFQITSLVQKYNFMPIECLCVSHWVD